MSAISYSQNYGDNVNPTQDYVPVNAGGYFADSNIFDNPSTTKIYGTNYPMLNYDRSFDQLTLGKYDASNAYIYMDIQTGNMELNAINGLRINGTLSGTAGGGITHLVLNVNGTNYKVQLLGI